MLVIGLEHRTGQGYSGVERPGAYQISVFGISDERRNRITMRGDIYRPGTYEFAEGMTAEDLILQARGLIRTLRLTRDLGYAL